MRTFPLFAVLFFVIPLIEIYVLVQVGSVIGALPTILLVVLTAVIGAFLLRQQGMSTLARFQQSVAKGEAPAGAMLEGVMLLIGGLLLMTPGFFTDTIGFACLLPFSRKWLAKSILRRVRVQPFNPQGGGTHTSYVHRDSSDPHGSPHTPGSVDKNSDSTTIDGDYTRKN